MFTVRDRLSVHHCAEPVAAAHIAAALRGAQAVTVTADAGPTRWRFTPTSRGVNVAADNPALFTDHTPPAWADRLAAAAHRLI